jgi:hypothetical protein
MFPGASGFRPMPRKMAGSEISTIEALMEASSAPNVVLDKATHL